MKTNYHYFVSSYDIWTSGIDILEVLQRHKKDTRAEIANVFLVPVPAETAYAIEMYVPQIEGTKCLGTVGLTGKKRKALSEKGEYFNPATEMIVANEQ